MTLLQEALAPRSDQLNADDLLPGPRTLRITRARFVAGDRGGKKIIINFDGDNGKPWHPCKTMGRAMILVWGILDSEDEEVISAQFAGKSVTVYRDPNVDFGNQKNIGGIRISHLSHIDQPKTVNLTVSQGKKGKFTFQPLVAEVRQMPNQADQMADWTGKFIAKVRQAPNADELNTYVAGQIKWLDKLSDELRSRADAEVSEMLAKFHPAEGREDADMGEGFNTEEEGF